MKLSRRQQKLLMSLLFGLVVLLYTEITRQPAGPLSPSSSLEDPTHADITPRGSDRGQTLQASGEGGSDPPEQSVASPSGSVVVSRVIDGDTIELVTGERVRYIGIDTPERGDCGFQEATRRNQELVGGKSVQLVKDVSETDRYGRLLRYVYIDQQMVNKQLVLEGYAQASSYPPDVKWQEALAAAQQAALQANVGIWGMECADDSPEPLR